MEKKDTFEDLYIWQDAIVSAKDIFQLFKDSKVFSIRNQIERAVVSVSTNIAEGYELDTNRQFVKFLYIAKGSCGEVRSLLLLSKELSHLKDKEARPLVEKCTKLSIMIYKMIKSRSSS